ncbi:bifunctional GNAT family N-acetyltransferase/carbon-nitrogen hydrolase family protein [Nonlabens ponticola]|uniref:GNAT family N-acetyltransferase n=1 Tax=Nonlabens ponticola TaxID=2496866 RepID=A0A3S9MWJ0_9FLAO|nr:bifunctional GNAT family N-acetyltransferase/carbon-nitrogen hydrolase family protein [Nonlabens ponticola]AZQ43585.1 GNAT family N-acetyltransferase [Nonlabens ponticola]
MSTTSQDKIENLSLEFLELADYDQLKHAMIDSYTNLPDSYWKKEQIKTLIDKFPEGQVVLKVNDEIVACALSIVVKYEDFSGQYTYEQVTGNYKFTTHDDDGDVLYGIEVFIKPQYRGMRLGRRLYDYRKELCENLNLRGIAFGGRIPGYHNYASEMSPKEYIEKVRMKEINDPVLNFQMSNDFHVSRVLKNYLDGDKASMEFGVLLEWDNIYYTQPVTDTVALKSTVRLGLIQWQMRPYSGIEELMQQVEYFVDSLAAYRSDFALFPEYFNAPLMAAYNDHSVSDAIRELAKYTGMIRDRFSELSIKYNINIITGSMPEIIDGQLYNVGNLCHRDGRVEQYEKIHVTPDEQKVWGLSNGSKIQTYDTDCGKIGILICYDSEFPELSRLLAEDGMQMLFVPFLTDTQNAYARVRLCCQARAVENECYVAIAGSVGNLPAVENMDISYAQSAVFTPCDFAFPSNGVKAEATPNTEMILVADVDLDLLKKLHNHGAVKNLKDRRTDLYSVVRK